MQLIDVFILMNYRGRVVKDARFATGKYRVRFNDVIIGQ